MNYSKQHSNMEIGNKKCPKQHSQVTFYPSDEKELNIIKSLICKKQYLHIDSQHNSLLHRLFIIFDSDQQSSTSAAMILINNGVNPNLRNLEGWTAIQLAFRCNQKKAILFAIHYNKTMPLKQFEFQKNIGNNELSILHIVSLKGYKGLLPIIEVIINQFQQQNINAFSETRQNLRARFMSQSDLTVWKQINKIEKLQLIKVLANDKLSWLNYISMYSENIDDFASERCNLDEGLEINFQFKMNVTKDQVIHSKSMNWQKILNYRQFTELLDETIIQTEITTEKYIYFCVILQLCLMKYTLSDLTLDLIGLLKILQIIGISCIQFYNILYDVRGVVDNQILQHIKTTQKKLTYKWVHQSQIRHKTQIDQGISRTRAQSFISVGRSQQMDMSPILSIKHFTHPVLYDYETLQNSQILY